MIKNIKQLINKIKTSLSHSNMTVVLLVLIALTVVASFGKILIDAKAWTVDSKGVPVVKYYRQCDSAWGSNNSGGGGTICNSGSGATTIAMVLSYYGKSVTPANTASSSDISAVATNYGLVATSNIGWSNTVFLLEKSRPIIITVGPSIFAGTREHHIVLKGKVGDTIYINDPSHPDITTASTSTVSAAFTAGTGKSVFVRPSDYDPCGWNGKVCDPTTTPTPTPTTTTGSTKPVISVTGVDTPTRDAVQSSGNVTVRGKVTDPKGNNVRLAFKLIKYTNGWDCSSLIYAGGAIDTYFPAGSTAGVASGSTIPYTFNNLTPGKYKYTMRARSSVPDWSDGVTLCTSDGGWLNPDTNYLTFVVPNTSTPTPSPTPVSTDTPTVILNRITKSGGYLSLWATPTDSKGHLVQVQFRIRRDDSSGTVAQKCATAIDSNFSGSAWSDLRASGIERGTVIATISTLTPGNYLASVRAKDSVGTISSGAKFCYENGATGGVAGADALGWVTAQAFTIP